MSEQSSLEEQLDIIDGVLKEYQENIKISCIKDFDEDVDQWLDADSSVLVGLDAESCMRVANIILRYHTYLTKVLSREKTKLKTVESIIYSWSCTHWPKYEKMYGPTDLKYHLIAKRDNLALEKPLKLRNQIRLRISSIEEIVPIIKDHYFFYTQYAKTKV